MTGPVIVLNGGSSSGKSSIARQLQARLAPEPWLTFGVDTTAIRPDEAAAVIAAHLARHR